MVRPCGKKMVTWMRDWLLSWHLTKGTLTETNGKVHLTAKQTYSIQMNIPPMLGGQKWTLVLFLLSIVNWISIKERILRRRAL